MAKIIFSQNVNLYGFNMGSTDNTQYPSNVQIEQTIEDNTKDSIVFSFVNEDMYQQSKLYAKYKSKALSRDKFVVYRQNINDSTKQYVATIDNVTDGFYDYNIGSDEQYKYIVETNPADQKEVNIAAQVSLETAAFIKPHWNYWSICDIVKDLDASAESEKDIYRPSDTIFMMKNNINAGSIDDNLNIIQYNTLGKYGVVIQNAQKYDSGNISCMISDFAVIQDLRHTNYVIVKDDISTVENRDNFLLSIQNNTEYTSYCFVFPNVDQTYYSYQPDNSKIIYQKLNINEDGEPSFWSDYYSEYYEYNNITKQYDKLVAFYNPIPSEKPSDWNDYQNYLQYYTKDANGVYIQNTNEVYDANTQYYKYEIPKFKNNYYYQMTVNSWVPIDSYYTITNDVEKMNAWRECLSNGKIKLLRAPNGQRWIVKVNGNNTLDINWNTSQYIATISFNWQEIDDINKISIIKW